MRVRQLDRPESSTRTEWHGSASSRAAPIQQVGPLAGAICHGLLGQPVLKRVGFRAVVDRQSTTDDGRPVEEAHSFDQPSRLAQSLSQIFMCLCIVQKMGLRWPPGLIGPFRPRCRGRSCTVLGAGGSTVGRRWSSMSPLTAATGSAELAELGSPGRATRRAMVSRPCRARLRQYASRGGRVVELGVELSDPAREPKLIAGQVGLAEVVEPLLNAEH